MIKVSRAYAHARTAASDGASRNSLKDSFVKVSSTAQQHLQQCQEVLQQMAKVTIAVENEGLWLSAAIGADAITWEPNDSCSQQFSQLPTPFAQSYLQLRLRDFLYETFCQAPTENGDAQLLEGNDRIGGGMHVGLLQQFEATNRGRGYAHPGWQVVREETADVLAVENYGVEIHIEREYHLRPEEQQAQVGDVVSVGMPCYRFELGAVVAIGEAGFVPENVQAIDIYLAVSADQMASVLDRVTTVLNGYSGTQPKSQAQSEPQVNDQFKRISPVPFTLKVPYRPEDYGRVESMVLRVRAADYEQILPLVRSLEQFCCGNNVSWPVFACPVCPGVSVAEAIASRASFWYGSSADLSRVEQVAAGLTQAWYEHSQQNPSVKVRSQAISSQLSAAGLDPAMPAWLAAEENTPG